MLGTCHEAIADAGPWESLPLRANVPSHDFFDRTGRIPNHPDERRGFVRYYFRRRAVLIYRQQRMAGLTVDMSRIGMGLISPVQLFPMQSVDVVLPDRTIALRVVRCQRLGERCYRCGCDFTKSATAP